MLAKSDGVRIMHRESAGNAYCNSGATIQPLAGDVDAPITALVPQDRAQARSGTESLRAYGASSATRSFFAAAINARSWVASWAPSRAASSRYAAS